MEEGGSGLVSFELQVASTTLVWWLECGRMSQQSSGILMFCKGCRTVCGCEGFEADIGG